MKLSAAAAHGAWLLSNLPAWSGFRRALAQPERTQRRLLRAMLQAHAETAYGRAHHFAGIGSAEEYRERVPLAGYETLSPYVRRIQRGERAVLTAEPVTHLVPTSGSTSARKLIPFTAGLQAQFDRAIGAWMTDLYGTHSQLVAGPSYWSISPAVAPCAEDSAVPVGFEDDSAYLSGLHRLLAGLTFAVPPCVRQVSDPEAHRYATLLALLRQRELRFVSVWHPSFLALLLEALPGWWEQLLQDVAHGTCHRLRSEAPAVQRALCAPPRPRRAAELRALGSGALSSLWPRWRMVSCWADAQAALPAAALTARFPHWQVQSKGLLATEGVVSIPFAGLHPLAITSHFLEFQREDGAFFFAHELQPQAQYRVILTTAGGLWRYPLGDLVEVDGFLHRTPSIRFLGRGEECSDLCGEKLTAAFVSAVLSRGCAACSYTPGFAMLAPELPPGPPHYTLFVEAPPPPGFGPELERALCENPHYAHCRALGQLGPVQICGVPAHAYRLYCETLLARGQRWGEIKPRALSRETDWRARLIGGRPS